MLWHIGCLPDEDQPYLLARTRRATTSGISTGETVGRGKRITRLSKGAWRLVLRRDVGEPQPSEFLVTRPAKPVLAVAARVERPGIEALAGNRVGID